MHSGIVRLAARMTARWLPLLAPRRISQDSHTAVDMTAFNTDGFDVHGRDIHIHHCTVWNQDDSFCGETGWRRKQPKSRVCWGRARKAKLILICAYNVMV